MSSTVLRSVRLDGRDAPTDLLVADGFISAIGDGLTGDEVVEFGGRFIGPGLWDAHVHVGQWALASARLDVSAARSAAETVTLVREHLATGEHDAGSVLVGSGFRDGLWPEAPTQQTLDAIDAPVALVSGDVHTMWVNAAALRLLGLPSSDWWLREQPAFDLNVRLSAVDEVELDAKVLTAARRAAERGVVGIGDFEFDDAPGAWIRRFGNGFRGLRIRAQVYPAHLALAAERGIRTGAVLGDSDGLLTGGAFKLFTDGSLNTRTAWCDDPYPGLSGPDAAGIPTYADGELLEVARAGVAVGIVPTIHAIGDRATSVALDVFEALGTGGSIQHAQLIRLADAPRFAALGVRASMQPEHALDDRDVTDHYWAGREGRAYAFRTLLDAGAELEFGSDAPVAPMDPWIAMAAAVDRTRDGREPWHPEQGVTRTEALAASQGGIASLEVGGAADLVVTDEDPQTVADLRVMPVHATMVAGEWTFTS